MRVLVVSEGASEIGSTIHSRPLGTTCPSSDPDESRGALMTLVRRLLPSVEFYCEFEKVGSKRLGRLHGSRGSPYFKRAVQWLQDAEQRGFDALVLVIDQDQQKERNQGIDEAQSHPRGVRRRALGVAIRSFDAWMLADERAVSQALEAPCQRQPDLESMTDPKETFERLREEAKAGARLPELYAIIAERLDLQTLEVRCPRGFRTFADRVRALQSS